MFRGTIGDYIQQYFEANTNTGSLKLIEWDAFKVVVRARCIAESMGIRRALLAEVAQQDSTLRDAERNRPGHPKLHQALLESREKLAEHVEKLRFSITNST